MMLVTLQQASDHLRRDSMDDNSDLLLKIRAASAAVTNYLKDPLLAYQYEQDSYGDIVLDSDGEPVLAVDSAGHYIVREEVQAAVLIMVGVLYIDRDAKSYVDGGSMPRLGNTSLPNAVHWILDPIRKPTVS